MENKIELLEGHNYTFNQLKSTNELVNKKIVEKYGFNFYAPKNKKRKEKVIALENCAMY